MAKQQLSPDQQQKLSKIMATQVLKPTPAPPPVVPAGPPPVSTMQAVTTPPAVEGPIMNAPPPANTVYSISTGTSGMKKKNSPMPILIATVVLVVLVGYTIFWLNFFQIIKLF